MHESHYQRFFFFSLNWEHDLNPQRLGCNSERLPTMLQAIKPNIGKIFYERY